MPTGITPLSYWERTGVRQDVSNGMGGPGLSKSGMKRCEGVISEALPCCSWLLSTLSTNDSYFPFKFGWNSRRRVQTLPFPSVTAWGSQRSSPVALTFSALADLISCLFMFCSFTTSRSSRSEEGEKGEITAAH